ncbi:serine endoprotease [Roseimaritima multifibrata]|uniref:Serine endoprotease n=1 Tax=Roseimaritima multifibrata TaxID=1930274 RepID=A0A517MB72_9BACT|nr:PDZ domain-containing protein [Roseimaritima multifibrata]QDS92101.1 serine endoprotease [Roseimaritima multifibrata]
MANYWSRRFSAFVITAASLGISGSVAVAQTEPTDSSAVNATSTVDSAPVEDAEQITKFVEQLGSNQYVQREIASLELAKRGTDVIPFLLDQVESGDLERTERTVQLLQRIALREEPTDPPLGSQALQLLAEQGGGAISSRSQATLRVVAENRTERAREALLQAGITVGFSDVVLEASRVSEEIVSISDEWNGDPHTLVWLKWIPNVHYVLLDGPKIDQSVIKAVIDIPDLQNIVISNADFDAKELLPLAELPRIDLFEIRYTPLDDDAIALLESFAIRQKLILNGTLITPEAVAEMKTKLPNLQVVYKRGGFLGVNCDPLNHRCLVTVVVAGGAAEIGGVRAGDIIVKVNEKEITRFADLLAAISVFAPGEEVKIEVDRHGRSETLTVTLGRL